MTEQTFEHGESASREVSEAVTEPEDAARQEGSPAGRRLRVGVLGAGRQGRALAAAIACVPECDLVGVCDVDEERAKSLAERYGARHYTLWQSMLIFLDMDAVFIATPTAMHAEHALTALQERRHVYLEKPPALSLDQARRIEEMATEQERIVHVGLQHRYSDLVPPFYQALEGRNISVVHVHLYRGVLDSAEEWGDELVGGVLFEEAFHLLDLVRFLVDEVVAVGAFTGQALWRDMPAWRSRDSAAIAFQLASGGCGTLTLTQALSLPLPGHLAMDVVAEGPVLARFTGEQLQVATEAGVETWTVEKPPLMTAVARFLEGVRSSNQGVLLAPYADVVRTLELVLACGRSVVEGRVVYLDV